MNSEILIARAKNYTNMVSLGLASAVVDDTAKTITFTLASDGSQHTVHFSQPSDGKDGKSAYDLWVEEGNAGTVNDFLESLKGETGAGGEVSDEQIQIVVENLAESNPEMFGGVSETRVNELLTEKIENEEISSVKKYFTENNLADIQENMQYTGNLINENKIELTDSSISFANGILIKNFDSATTAANYYKLCSFSVPKDGDYELILWDCELDSSVSSFRIAVADTMYFTQYISAIKGKKTYNLISNTKYYLSIRLDAGAIGNFSFKVSLSSDVLTDYTDMYNEKMVTDFKLKENALQTKVLKNGNILFGKKWAVCGDSFSAGDFNNALNTDYTITDGLYKGKNKVYGYLIGNRNDMVIQNLSAGGRTMGLPSDHEITGFTNSFINYYQSIDNDVDYITIYLGINDNHHLNGNSNSDGEDVTGIIPIGTLDDTTTDTFCGAYQTVLNWIIVNRPNAKIGIIVTNGLPNTTEYRDKTIAIAKKYGIPYIDLNGDERTPAMHRTCNPDIATSVKQALMNKWSVNPSKNTHPSAKAHEYESTIIESFLRSL